MKHLLILAALLLPVPALAQQTTVNLGSVASATSLGLTVTGDGSGTNGPATAQNGAFISLVKNGWNAGTTHVGELDPLQIFGRQGGPGSDMSGILINVQNTGTGFLSATEFASSIIQSFSNTITQDIDIQEGGLDGLTGEYNGAVYTSVIGSLGNAILTQDTPGAATWTNVLLNLKSNVPTVILDPSGNLTLAGTVNAPVVHGTALSAGTVTLASLPSPCTIGNQMYATDARKPGEGAGLGSGAEVICSTFTQGNTAGGWFSMFDGRLAVK